METDRYTEAAVDVVILGAGISGLVAAKIVNENKQHRILIIDEYDRIGGNHINCDFGAFTFDIGTLIFQDDSPLMKYFPELLAVYHPITWSISRITSDNVVRDYPISMRDEVYGAGPIQILRILGSILWGRCRFRRFDSADAYARYWMGSRLFETSGLAHYIERFCGAPATAIDPKFAEKRMGWIADAASIRKRLRQVFSPENAGKPNQSFLRPREGFSELYTVTREILEREGTSFALGESLRSIECQNEMFRVTTDRLEVTCKRLISTIPVDRAYALCKLGPAKPLPYSKLISLFFSFDGKRGFESSILYNFSHKGSWKRLTMFSDFFGKAQSREYFGVEVVATDRGPGAVARAIESFRCDVKNKGLFVGSLDSVGSHELDNAYPIYFHGAIDTANHMMASLRTFGVESMGRQGAFDYLPTARQVTLAVEESMRYRIKRHEDVTG